MCFSSPSAVVQGVTAQRALPGNEPCMVQSPPRPARSLRRGPACSTTREAMSLSAPQLSVTELSIADIQARFAQGLLTCTELTQRLLQRIERYDKQGPGLNALITVSPHALETARQ